MPLVLVGILRTIVDRLNIAGSHRFGIMFGIVIEGVPVGPVPEAA